MQIKPLLSQYCSFAGVSEICTDVRTAFFKHLVLMLVNILILAQIFP